MEDVALNSSTSEPKSKEGGYWSKEYACSRIKLLALIIILVIFVIIIIVLAALLGNARSKGSKEPRSARPTTSSAPVPTTPGTEAWWKIRLPRDVVPVHYNIYVNLTIDLPRFDGKAVIEFNVTSPTDLLLIHTRGLNYSHVALARKVNPKDFIAIKKQFEFKKNEFYVIQTNSVLNPGLYILKMKYEAFFATVLDGLYLSKYKKPDGNTSNFCANLFQPVRARSAFPCFDEPGLKATFNVTIAHRSEYVALSNMPMYRSESVKGQTLDYFGKTVPMPTYLLAFVVGDFKYRETRTKNNVEMRIYSRPSVINQTSFAANDGSVMLTFFEKYFDEKYSMPKADMIALPDFPFGAMENWGLIMYKERYLLWERSVSSEFSKLETSDMISHELVHQWYGNIVTMKWWDDLWLNEGFATYIASKGTNAAHPDWKTEERFIGSVLHKAIVLDGLATSHPVKVPVNSPNEINEIFDAISYNKGASILRMLESFLGSEVFKKGIRSYIKKYLFSNGETDDLWQALNKASQESCKSKGSCVNVKHVMDTWTLQMGYPVVKLTKDSGSKYLVTQKHFLLDKTANVSKSKYKSPFNYTWVIPFTFVSTNNNNPNQIHWMDKDSTFVNDNSPWIKGNYGHKGYYIVNYESSNWKALTDQLNKDHKVFNASDRAGLIFDAFTLARGSQLGYDTAFNITTYMKKEKDLVPWEILDNHVNTLRILLSQSSPVYKKLQKYLIRQSEDLYKKLGFSASGSHLEIFQRRIVLGLFCRAGVSSCVKNATLLFHQWMKNPKQTIAPNLRSLVLQYGVAYGGVKEWEFVYQQFQKTETPNEQQDMLNAMAATTEPWLLARYLDYSVDSTKITKDKLWSVLSYVSDNPVGNRVAWDFVRRNWKQISEMFSGELFLYWRVMPILSSYFSTDYELQELIQFTNGIIERTGVETAKMEQVVEKVKANVMWSEKNAETIDNWLTKYITDNKI